MSKDTSSLRNITPASHGNPLPSGTPAASSQLRILKSMSSLMGTDPTGRFSGINQDYLSRIGTQPLNNFASNGSSTTNIRNTPQSAIQDIPSHPSQQGASTMTGSAPMIMMDGIEYFNEGLRQMAAGNINTAQLNFQIFQLMNQTSTSQAPAPSPTTSLRQAQPALAGPSEYHTSPGPPQSSQLASTSLVDHQTGQVTEGGLTFQPGGLNVQQSVGLPAVLHKNVQDLQGIIPLTAMDPRWQEEAASWQADRRSQTSILKDLTSTYRGLPYPNDWTQNSVVFNRNFNYFLIMLRNVFGYNWFADRMAIHRSNVEWIAQTYRSWVVAFRYHLRIWRAVFASRLTGTPVPDPGVWQPRVLEEVYTQARVLGDLAFNDNPYATGGPRDNWDPTTGLPRTGNQTNQASTEASSSSSWIPAAFDNSATKSSNAKAQNTQKATHPNSNYKGKRFDPNYKRDNKKDDKNDKGNGKGKDKEKEKE